MNLRPVLRPAVLTQEYRQRRLIPEILRLRPGLTLETRQLLQALIPGDRQPVRIRPKLPIN